MIRYALKCKEGHEFESWFQSASAFDVLAKAGHLSCAICGGTEVTKSLMAPRVGADKDKAVVKSQEDQQAAAIAEVRREVEENATYVGGKFAKTLVKCTKALRLRRRSTAKQALLTHAR